MPTLNLEYYRKQAKSLLHFAQTGDAAALERIALHRGNVDPAQVKLHDAQLAIAREQGFASWPKFREFVEQSGLDDQSLVDAFIDAATSDLKRADESLAANPKIARAGFLCRARARQLAPGGPSCRQVAATRHAQERAAEMRASDLHLFLALCESRGIEARGRPGRDRARPAAPRRRPEHHHSHGRLSRQSALLPVRRHRLEQQCGTG
jgi:hypothetical protein